MTMADPVRTIPRARHFPNSWAKLLRKARGRLTARHPQSATRPPVATSSSPPTPDRAALQPDCGIWSEASAIQSARSRNRGLRTLLRRCRPSILTCPLPCHVGLTVALNGPEDAAESGGRLVGSGREEAEDRRRAAPRPGRGLRRRALCGPSKEEVPFRCPNGTRSRQ